MDEHGNRHLPIGRRQPAAARLVSRLASLALAACLAPLLAGGAPSFAREQLVHSERSQYQSIYVVEDDARRCLRFTRIGAVQSCIERADPLVLALNYTRSMMVGLFVRPAPQRVLMIGLGGGSIPRALHALDPQTRIDVVELDPAIVRIATEHFGFVPDERMQAFVDDGRAFVERQQRAGVRYDLVLLDAFDEDYIPEHLLTEEFLAGVRAILTPDGAVVANTYAGGPLRDRESATYQAVFDDVYAVTGRSGNRILLAGAALPPLQRMRVNAQRLAASLQRFGVSTASLMEHLSRVPRTDAQPLKDRARQTGRAGAR